MRRILSASRVAGFVAAAVAMGACSSSLQVNTDWNTTLDFTHYRTWNFQVDTSSYTTFNTERLRNAIASTLTAKGLTRSGQNPDLMVIYKVNLGSTEQMTTTGGAAWGPYRGGGVSTTSVQHIPTGALTIAMIDSKLNQLVWRGMADAQLQSDQGNSQVLDDAIAKMFAQFPPKAGQQPSSSDF